LLEAAATAELHGETRRLRYFAGGLMAGLIAEQTVLFAVPLIIYQNTKSVTYSGMAFALEWIPALIAYPFAGLLADLFGGRFLFLNANLARAVCLFTAMLVCALAPSFAVIVLMINGMLLSTLMAPIRMAVEKTVPTLASGEKLARTQSLVQNVELLSMALGPGLAAGLAQLLGKLPLLGVAATSFLLAAAAWRVLPASARRAVDLGQVRRDLALGWKLLLSNRPVIRLAALNFLINLAFAVVISANAYLITDAFHASDFVFGLMNTGAGAIGLLNLLLIPRLLLTWSIYRVGIIGFLLLCTGLLSMGLAGNVWFYVPAFLWAMAGAALFNVFNRTQRIKAIDREHLGKVIGPFYLINSMSLPLGGVVTASLGHELGIQNILLCLTFLLAVPGGALLWITIRHFRERLSTDALIRSNENTNDLAVVDTSGL